MDDIRWTEALATIYDCAVTVVLHLISDHKSCTSIYIPDSYPSTNYEAVLSATVIWGFPEIGLPAVIIHSNGIFLLQTFINHKKNLGLDIHWYLWNPLIITGIPDSWHIPAPWWGWWPFHYQSSPVPRSPAGPAGWRQHANLGSQRGDVNML